MVIGNNAKNLFLLLALLAGLGLILAGRVTAQTFTTLYTFAGGGDGARPWAELASSGNLLYGTARTGGSSGHGTVFSVRIDGTGFKTLHSFTRGDGAMPNAGLILSGKTLYGTAISGGSWDWWGTVFKVNTDGDGFTILHGFTAPSGALVTNTDGVSPSGMLFLSGSTLYGTASRGGNSHHGTVFAVQTDGTGFAKLHSFNFSDGAYPYAGLVLSGTTLYGVASSGGSSGVGAVFKVTRDGTSFTTLHSFAGGDGVTPADGLILSGNTLYGTTQGGGGSGNGTVFAVKTDGTGFTNLHSFTVLSNPWGAGTNGDGAYVQAGLFLSGDTLYGTASRGGSSGNGTVFAVKTDGTGFTALHCFSAGLGSFPDYTNGDGAFPHARLILSRNTLYGTAESGGIDGAGTVFSLSLP